MPRRDSDYDVVYLSRPREVVYEIPRRSATSRDYDTRPYASERYNERPRGYRDNYPCETIVVSGLSDNYGPDAYYQPSRTPQDSCQPKRPIAEERRSARFATEHYQRRRRSSDDHSRRRPDSPHGYYNARGDRGRVDERRSSPSRRLRSAIRGSRNESPEAQRRARSRSVSFRETEVSRHDVGNQKHERPGYEARAIGQYLRRDDDDDLASETYAIRRKSRRYS
jgi:hypothetical protein